MSLTKLDKRNDHAKQANTKIRKGGARCSILALFYFSCQLCLISIFFCTRSKAFQNEKGTSIFPASEQQKHFTTSIAPYTNFSPAERSISSDSFIKDTPSNSYNTAIYRYFFHDYLASHRKHRAKPKRLLIFKPQGSGLGDRFGCLVFAYWAAVVTNRVFLIDWQKPYPLDSFMEGAHGLDIFLKKDDPWYKLINQSKFKHDKKADYVFLTNNRTLVSEYERFIASNISIVVLNTNRTPKRFSTDSIQTNNANITRKYIVDFSGDPNFQRAVLHHVLRFTSKIRSDIHKVATSLSLCPGPERQNGKLLSGKLGSRGRCISKKKSRPYIGVHARVGVGVGEKGTRFTEIAQKLTAAARCLGSRAIRISQMSGSPALPIFLATDTPKFRDIFKREVKKMSHGQVDVVAGDWNIVHLAQLRGKAKVMPNDKQKKDWEAMWGSFVDVIMLGHAEHILALYSSYPRLALAIGDAETLVEIKNEICLQREDWRNSSEKTWKV